MPVLWSEHVILSPRDASTDQLGVSVGKVWSNVQVLTRWCQPRDQLVGARSGNSKRMTLGSYIDPQARILRANDRFMESAITAVHISDVAHSYQFPFHTTVRSVSASPPQ